MKRIALAKWEPDKFGLANLGQSDAKNVIASGTGYIPVKALSAISSTGLSGACLGAISTQDATDTTKTFAGDATKLYLLAAGVFSNVSKSGNYTVAAGEHWEFIQYGQRVIAVQIGVAVQYYDLGSSTLFDNLAGSPPNARHIAGVRDFVVLGNTTTSEAQIVWSGFNDSAGWAAGVNQSDAQTLQGGGAVQCIIGGEVGFIFQDRAITRMAYVGPPTYFQFDKMEDARGLSASRAAVRVGGLIYFKAQDGFYVFDGTQSIPIGSNAVDDWFASHVQPGTEQYLVAAADPAGKTVRWGFVSTDVAGSSRSDTMLIYNWQQKEWSYAKVDHEYLFASLTEGVTLEQLSAIYSNIETVPASFDSAVFTGGAAYLAAFDTTHNLAAFSGTNLAATMQTGDFEGVPGRRSLINNVRPMTDSSSMTAVCRSRERFADMVTDTNSGAMATNGDIPLLSSGRFHQVELNVPAGATWAFANAVDVDAVDDGEL